MVIRRRPFMEIGLELYDPNAIKDDIGNVVVKIDS